MLLFLTQSTCCSAPVKESTKVGLLFDMLFAMTSTLCAGRALPLPVYLKIHLVAGWVCVWHREGRRLFRPKQERWFECMCVCLCRLYEAVCLSLRDVAHCPLWQEEQLSLCDRHVCAHVWACVTGGKELTLSFMTVSIMSSSTVHCYPSVICVSSSEAEEKSLSNTALIALWLLPYLFYFQRKRRWPPPLPHCLYCPLKYSWVPMKWLRSHRCPNSFSFLSWKSLFMGANLRKLPSVSLNKCCFWLEGRAVRKGRL